MARPAHLRPGHEGGTGGERPDAGGDGGIKAGAEANDWQWIYGRVATALGCLPSAIDEEPAVNILELLSYWREEPPTHVLLAMRYLGPGGGKKQITEKEARKDMGEMARLLGPARRLPPNLKQMIQQAEQLKQQHKGM